MPLSGVTQQELEILQAAGVDVERSFRTGCRARACASYLANELVPRGIRMQAISASPLRTRAPFASRKERPFADGVAEG